MAKKNKDEVPNPHSVTNRDIIQRLNFLYQAGIYLSGISTENPAAPKLCASANDSTDGKNKRSRKRRRTGMSMTAPDLARSYVETMKSVGQRTVVKMDPTVKRTLCKGCNTILLPGATATVRVKACSSHGHAVVYKCTVCETSRRIPAPPILRLDVQGNPIPSTESELNAANQPESLLGDDMHVDLNSDVKSARSKKRMNKRKKMPSARLQPFFERDIGHVIFRGNEKVEQTDR